MVSYIAIGYFAGPRKSELLKITKDMIVDDHFLFPAIICKTGWERVVPITPVLRSWLDIDCTLDGWANHVERFAAIAKLANVQTHHNGLRHSYATHNYSVLGAEETAKRMGDSPSILKKHYANPRVTRAELARYHSMAETSAKTVLGELLTKPKAA